MGKSGRVVKRFTDVLFFKVRKVCQQLWHRAACGDGFDNHTYRYAHPSNARFATHYVRVECDALEFLHIKMIALYSKTGFVWRLNQLGGENAKTAAGADPIGCEVCVVYRKNG